MLLFQQKKTHLQTLTKLGKNAIFVENIKEVRKMVKKAINKLILDSINAFIKEIIDTGIKAA